MRCNGQRIIGERFAKPDAKTNLTARNRNMEFKQAICVLFLVYFVDLGSAQYGHCHSSSDCQHDSTTICSCINNWCNCNSNPGCKSDSDCDGGFCCDPDGSCSNDCCKTIFNGALIAATVVGSTLFLAIVIITLVSCLCCVCCPCYRLRVPNYERTVWTTTKRREWVSFSMSPQASTSTLERFDWLICRLFAYF